MPQPSHPDSAHRARTTHDAEQHAARRFAAAEGYALIVGLGMRAAGGSAYLAREEATATLVGLNVQPKTGKSKRFNISLVYELTAEIPGPTRSCPRCAAEVDGWIRMCPCGEDLAGIAPADDEESASLFDRVREQTAGELEILGTLPFAGGGGRAYFAHDYDSGAMVALTLHESYRDGTPRFVVSRSAPLPSATPDRSARSAPVRYTPGGAPRVASDAHTAEELDEAERKRLEIDEVRRLHPDMDDAERTRLELSASGLGSGLLAKQPTPLPEQQVAVPRVCPQCGGEYETGSRFCPNDGTPLRPKGNTDVLVGRVIAERYHVLKRLGEGGMGRVYLAEHVKMNRQCAIKVMSAALVNDSDSAARFAREASNAARIINPNVAAVFDYGESDGLVYLVMEYVDGEPLSRLMEREKVLAPHRVLDIARQVADGLGAAHELGIVHRDLKPDNIIVAQSRNGREVAKVVDFGIAKAMQESPLEALTHTGLVIGTPEFMSPEQLLADPVDARSDLYSLGCIVYQMLTGSPAFDAPTREQMIKRRLTEEPPRPRGVIPELPEPLDGTVARMLARAPADRFSSAAELRDSLLPAVALGIEWDPSYRPTPRSAPTISMEVLGTTQKLPADSKAQRWRSRWMAGTVGVGAVVVMTGVALLTNSAGTAVGSVGQADSAVLVGASTGVAASVTAPFIGPVALASDTSAPVVDPAAVNPASANSSRTARNSAPRRSSRPSATTRAVRAPIEEYARAMESGTAGEVRRVYPGMSGKQFEFLRNNLFAIVDKIDAKVSYRGEPIVKGSLATTEFTLHLGYQYRSSKTPGTSDARYLATLVRDGTGWKLQELQQQP